MGKLIFLKFIGKGLDKINNSAIICLNKLMEGLIKLKNPTKEVKNMPKEWSDLTRLTQGAPIVVERVRLTEENVAIEGEFELPPLARLSADDQVFVMAFVLCHGSIKEIERIFGVSYPTVKNRLNRLANKLEFVETLDFPDEEDVLERLENGDIDAEEAIRRLSE